MAGSANEVIERVMREIVRLFSEVELTEAEKQFVKEQGEQLAKAGLEALLKADQVDHMRPFIIAMAIADTIGPTQAWEKGVDALDSRKEDG